jgi:pentatricopeptide repeat protein
VKPTIVTINAAVSGLLRRQQPEAAQRVLAWAGKFGISPDIITYNTLLRPLIREGNSAAAMKLFQQMEKAGVQADVATFTTILDETFRHADQHTPEEQKEIIDSIFHEMEAAGVEANLHTYGKIIYGLLQNPLGDMSVVNTIIERMAKQGLQPSTHIYTNLLFYYFDKKPPDLDAVRSLIERARMEVGSIDHKFWDRVVEGYARAGETTSAVRILREVTSTHNKVSWLTLGELLTALAENEEWDIARSIVRNAVVDTGGPLPDNERGKEGQHRFWRLARELQLLDGA